MQLPTNINSADVAEASYGRAAARSGQPVTTCPHDPASREGKFWIFGWASVVPAELRRAA